TSVEVQLTPAVKVAASVLVADSVRDVAILWISPTVIATVKPVPLGCQRVETRSVEKGQEIYAIGVPLSQPKDMASGTVSGVAPHGILADLLLARGTAGGPVFTADGGVVGITSVVVDENGESKRGEARVVRLNDVCDVVASAEKKMANAAPPSPAHLPVEPLWPYPMEALKDAAQRRAGSLSPYQISSSTFDVAFITPLMIYGSHSQSEAAGKRAPSKGPHVPATEPALAPLKDFSNWSE